MTEFVKVAGVETPVEVAQILNKIIDEKGNVDLDNLSEVGEKRFSDLSSSITNVKNSVSSLTTTVNGKIGASVSRAANGYIKFTNGVIIQWGGLTIPTSNISIKFPTAFTSNLYCFMMHSTYARANINAPLQTFNASGNFTTTGCILRTTISNYSLWLAIGY